MVTLQGARLAGREGSELPLHAAAGGARVVGGGDEGADRTRCEERRREGQGRGTRRDARWFDLLAISHRVDPVVLHPPAQRVRHPARSDREAVVSLRRPFRASLSNPVPLSL